MTAFTPALVRPSVGTLRLRNGEQAVTISAAGQRVIVRPQHMGTLIEDLIELEDEEAE
ncbi:hypothetical protein [Pseudactinotalea sp.]|uniref:hypothetical protein n=1 Tax=Pseudactinotalea sp. TaxID=1926260 RepID=UPI003B3A6955